MFPFYLLNFKISMESQGATNIVWRCSAYPSASFPDGYNLIIEQYLNHWFSVNVSIFSVCLCNHHNQDAELSSTQFLCYRFIVYMLQMPHIISKFVFHLYNFFILTEQNQGKEKNPQRRHKNQRPTHLHTQGPIKILKWKL